LEQYNFENPEDVLQRCLGNVNSIILSKTEGFIQDYENIVSPIKYNALIKEVEEQYNAAKEKALKTIGGTLDKDYLFNQMRYIKLKGSIGVIKVGGISEIQQRCDKDSIDDAVLACKSAFENGYVRGMNIELLMVIRELLSTYGGLKGYTVPILKMLYKSIYDTSLQVIRNKISNNNERRRISLIDSNLNKTTNSEQVQDYPIVMNLSNEEILEILITDKKMYDYDLRTEEFHTRDCWKIINSAVTDIEILRALLLVFYTTVITSNQFISTTRRFDSRLNDEKEIIRRISDEKEIIKNKTSAIIVTLLANDVFKDFIKELVKKK
jgi:hypothetical protein